MARKSEVHAITAFWEGESEVMLGKPTLKGTDIMVRRGNTREKDCYEKEERKCGKGNKDTTERTRFVTVEEEEEEATAVVVIVIVIIILMWIIVSYVNLGSSWF